MLFYKYDAMELSLNWQVLSRLIRKLKLYFCLYVNFFLLLERLYGNNFIIGLRLSKRPKDYNGFNCCHRKLRDTTSCYKKP